MNKRYYLIIGALATICVVSVAVATNDRSLQYANGAIILAPGTNRNVKISDSLRVSSLQSLDGTGSPEGVVPLGGVIPVMPSTHANAWVPPAAGIIKDGFMRADGTSITAQNVTDGCRLPAGTILPNLTTKYPRGSNTSGPGAGSNAVTLTSAHLPVLSASATSAPQSPTNHTHPFTHGHSTGDIDTDHRHTEYSHSHTAIKSDYQSASHSGSLSSNTTGSHIHPVRSSAPTLLGYTWGIDYSPHNNSGATAFRFVQHGTHGEGFTITSDAGTGYHSHGLSAMSSVNSGVHTATIGTSSPTTVAAADAAGAHTHPLTAAATTSGPVSADHYHKVTASIGSGTPSTNIEPSHLDAVWVIRVM